MFTISTVERTKQIVDDACEPFTDIDCFTEEDLKTTPLVELYRRSCRVCGTKPNRCVEQQLPAMLHGKPFTSVMVLNSNDGYLGNKGTAALIPVIDACPRLTHLILPRVGLKANVAKTLLSHLECHSGIREVDLSFNDLGTSVGKQILQLLINHRRIYSMGLDETLIIPQLKKKIDSQLTANLAIKDSFSIPMIPPEYDDNELIQAKKLRDAEEAERQWRAEVLRKEIAERIPTWAPAAIAELRNVLKKHQRFMENVFSVFASSAPVDGSGHRCTPESFVRGMKILGVQSLQSATEELCRQFAELFDAWDNGSVLVGQILYALRVHVVIDTADASTGDRFPREGDHRVQRALDRLYDVREIVYRSIEDADVDFTNRVRCSELLAGVSSVTRDANASIAIVKEFWRRTKTQSEPTLEAAAMADDTAHGASYLPRIVIGDSDVTLSYPNFFESIVLESTEEDESLRWAHATRTKLRNLPFASSGVD